MKKLRQNGFMGFALILALFGGIATTAQADFKGRNYDQNWHKSSDYKKRNHYNGYHFGSNKWNHITNWQRPWYYPSRPNWYAPSRYSKGPDCKRPSYNYQVPRRRHNFMGFWW